MKATSTAVGKTGVTYSFIIDGSGKYLKLNGSMELKFPDVFAANLNPDLCDNSYSPPTFLDC